MAAHSPVSEPWNLPIFEWMRDIRDLQYSSRGGQGQGSSIRTDTIPLYIHSTSTNMGRLDTIDSRLEVADQHTRIIGSLALDSGVERLTAILAGGESSVIMLAASHFSMPPI